MRLPQLTEFNSSRQSIINFLGLNYGAQTRDGELEQCMNLSTDDFPLMSQRKKRLKDSDYISPTTLFFKSGLFVIDGTRVLFKNEYIGDVTEGKKQMAAVGDYVLIFPDKKYYNVESKVFGDMEASYTSGAGEITFAATSTSDSQKYATITTTGADFTFRAGDAVEISGCTVNPENNQTIIIREVDGKVLKFYENSFTAGKETGAVTIKRPVPDLEFICESNYRLWGCAGNTIYGSKYADPLNFQVFDGLTSDSYYIQVGSDGNFTGCIPFSSYICFFKEDILHKLYGSKPSNYQLVTSNIYGVKEGCERSMCIINETLYYLGRNGVYAFTGGIPELVSEGFGTKRFTDACAGSDGNKYYISMTSGDEAGIFVYDVLRSLWLKEDNTKALQFADMDGHLYFIAEDGRLYRTDAQESESDEVIEWMASFCPFNETINERKGYSKMSMRLELEKDAWLRVEIKTDDERWKEVYRTHNKAAKTIVVPIHPNRCDSFKVRLTGKGYCRIKSFVRDFFIGSEV